MAYKMEGRDIVWDGFEKGISDDPYNGIADIVGMNLVSIPEEASVSFSPSLNNYTLVGTIASINLGTNFITGNQTGGTLPSWGSANFIAVQFTTTGTLPAGLSLATTYWINTNGSDFKVFTNCYLNGTEVDITGAGTGTHTFTSIDLGEVRYTDRTLGYCIDVNGRAWSPVIDGSSGTSIVRYTFMNNLLTDASGNGLVVFKGTGTTKWLFVFRNNKIDYTQCADTLGIFYANGITEGGITPSWTNGWKTLITASTTNNPHEVVIDGTNKVFFTDGAYVGTWRELPTTTFDPTNTATYEFVDTTSSAFAIPMTDVAQSIEVLGSTVLIGGLYNFVYTWDRKSTSGDWFQIAEKGIFKMITVSTNVFIFAGKRGRIYKSNGSQAQLFKKIPDHLIGIDPVFNWKGVAYNKNQLYFGFTATTNDGTSSNLCSGLWAIDVDTGALRRPTLCSTTTGSVVSIFAMPSNATGYSLLTFWKSGSTYGVDSTLATPYTTYVPYVVTDMTPIGLYLNKRTPENIEFKLSVPLVSGEGVKIYYRTNLNATFENEVTGISGLIGECTTVGNLSDVFTTPFENAQWVQFKVYTKSTGSTPSFTRLKEIRIR